MHEPFTLTREAQGPAVVIRITGRLDARSSPQLLQACAGLERPGSHVVLNLSRVSFLSSSGVGALLSLSEEFRGPAGSFRLAPASTEVRSAIRLLNLEPFLAIHESEADALAQLPKAA
ncbi:MAG: STAS domain-containing protein [Candidatus Eiseniibacteriota bacterium]